VKRHIQGNAQCEKGVIIDLRRASGERDVRERCGEAAKVGTAEMEVRGLLEQKERELKSPQNSAYSTSSRGPLKESKEGTANSRKRKGFI